MSADDVPYPPGFIETSADGGFTQAAGDGRAARLDVPAGQAGELRDLLGLRDAVRALVEAEASTRGESAGVEDLRAELGQRHDAYVAGHGPVDGGRGPSGRAAHVAFGQDPYAPLVYALEHRHPATGEVARSEVFTQRVVTEPGQLSQLRAQLGLPAVPEPEPRPEPGVEAV